MPIPMPNDRFPGFFQYRMEKNEFAVEMKTLYDFPYFLIHVRPFDVISSYSKGIYMMKVDKKKTRTRCETCLKLKLKK